MLQVVIKYAILIQLFDLQYYFINLHFVNLL